MNSEDNAHYNQLFYWIIISTNYMRGTAFMGICEGKFMDQHYCFTTCILAQIGLLCSSIQMLLFGKGPLNLCIFL
ncbi:hypothetical protein ACSBR1_037290 [Camellia fascicularis]